MGKIFPLFTQLRNLTQRSIRFGVDGQCCLLPVLPPGKTRSVKLHRILRYSREYGSPGWRIRVLTDDYRFTGIELAPSVLLSSVRIVFTQENGSGVLCVDGVPENCSDFLLRHKYFGCMRNIFWDDRPTEAIDRSDSTLATKLRNLEGGHYGQHLAPLVDASLPKERKIASPVRKLDDNSTFQAIEKTESPKYTVKAAVPLEKPKIILLSPPQPPWQKKTDDPDQDFNLDSDSDFDLDFDLDSDRDSDQDSDRDSNRDFDRDSDRDSDQDVTDAVPPEKPDIVIPSLPTPPPPRSWQMKSDDSDQDSDRDSYEDVTEAVPLEKPKIIPSPSPPPPPPPPLPWQMKSKDPDQDYSDRDSNRDSDQDCDRDSNQDSDLDSYKGVTEAVPPPPSTPTPPPQPMSPQMRSDSSEDSSGNMYFDSSSDHEELSDTSSGEDEAANGGEEEEDTWTVVMDYYSHEAYVDNCIYSFLFMIALLFFVLVHL
ncbi:hypothetical protein ABFS83_05G132800 [Erythranthe nasuta]